MEISSREKKQLLGRSLRGAYNSFFFIHRGTLRNRRVSLCVNAGM